MANMSQDDPLHPHPGPDLGPDHEPEQVEGVLEGVVQDPATDPEPDPHEQVRLWSTERLQAMITDLEPYTTGALGEISPRHAQMRIAAIRELVEVTGPCTGCGRVGGFHRWWCATGEPGQLTQD